MNREIVQLKPHEREHILQAARLLIAHRTELAKDWKERWDRNHTTRGSQNEVHDFNALVDLFLLSLADGDFTAYFDRIEARGADLARTQREYEGIVLSFHLFEEAAYPYLRKSFPTGLAQVTAALDHLYHNDIALLSRAYFREIEMERESFYHILTHDLKNSLTSLVGCTELLEKQLNRNSCNNACNELLSDIRRSADVIESQIETALAYGQLKHGKVELQVRQIDLEQLTLEAVLGVHRQVEEEGKSLLFQGTSIHQWAPSETSSLPTILGDETLLHRAITNYLTNALKYARQEVRIQVSSRENRIRVKVCDDGEGIPAEYQKRIFEDYFQVPGSRPGTGLGLPSVRRIIELHQGAVGVEATSEGSCFWLDLPSTD